MEVRQSLKAIKAGYALCVLAELILCVLWWHYQPQMNNPPLYAFWVVAAIPLILGVFVVIRHIRRLMTRITITKETLHFETGLLSKATRTVELAKVQDVRVSQTVLQRIFNIGDASLETAGSSSRIVMDSIDRPQDVANHILDMARAAGKQAPSQSSQNQSNQSASNSR